MKAWDIYDPQYVGAVWRRSFVDSFKWDSECLFPCEGTCYDDPCVLPGFLNLRLQFPFPSSLLKLPESTQNEQWTHFSSPRSHGCSTAATGGSFVRQCCPVVEHWAGQCTAGHGAQCAFGVRLSGMDSLLPSPTNTLESIHQPLRTSQHICSPRTQSKIPAALWWWSLTLH